MKLRAPPNASGPLAHNGMTFEVSDQGCLDVPDESIGALLAHGCRPWPQAESNASDSCSQSGTHSLQTSETPASNEAEPQTPQGDLATIGANEIEAMNRPALFAFLRARAIVVSLPITNNDLRALARGCLIERA